MIAMASVGLLAGCATREHHMARLSDLPMPVQNTIRAHSPSGDIARVEKDMHGGREVYNVSFRQPALNPEMQIASDGTLLSVDQPLVVQQPVIIREQTPVIIQEAAPATVVTTPGATTRFEDLPLAVQNAIRAKMPNAKIIGVTKESRPGVVYDVKVAEQGPSQRLHIAEDGTFVE